MSPARYQTFHLAGGSLRRRRRIQGDMGLDTSLQWDRTSYGYVPGQLTGNRSRTVGNLDGREQEGGRTRRGSIQPRS